MPTGTQSLLLDASNASYLWIKKHRRSIPLLIDQLCDFYTKEKKFHICMSACQLSRLVPASSRYLKATTEKIIDNLSKSIQNNLQHKMATLVKNTCKNSFTLSADDNLCLTYDDYLLSSCTDQQLAGFKVK